jgi:hypothetical protein
MKPHFGAYGRPIEASWPKSAAILGGEDAAESEGLYNYFRPTT